MTFHRGAIEYLVTCDYPGCTNEDVHHTLTMKEALSTFRYKGWSIGKKCLCPEHSGKEGWRFEE